MTSTQLVLNFVVGLIEVVILMVICGAGAAFLADCIIEKCLSILNANNYGGEE
jgi:hypothetical protein